MGGRGTSEPKWVRLKVGRLSVNIAEKRKMYYEQGDFMDPTQEQHSVGKRQPHFALYHALQSPPRSLLTNDPE